MIDYHKHVNLNQTKSFCVGGGGGYNTIYSLKGDGKLETMDSELFTFGSSYKSDDFIQSLEDPRLKTLLTDSDKLASLRSIPDSKQPVVDLGDGNLWALSHSTHSVMKKGLFGGALESIFGDAMGGIFKSHSIKTDSLTLYKSEDPVNGSCGKWRNEVSVNQVTVDGVREPKSDYVEIKCNAYLGESQSAKANLNEDGTVKLETLTEDLYIDYNLTVDNEEGLC